MTEQIENIIFAVVGIIALVGVVALWRIGTWVRNVYYAIEDIGQVRAIPGSTDNKPRMWHRHRILEQEAGQG